MSKTMVILSCLVLTLAAATVRAEGAGGPLQLSVVKVKPKGSWTEVTIAVENTAQKDLEFKCCTTYLETANGYAVASLDRSEVQSQIHNKAKTGAIIGGILGLGLGLGGAISGHEELGYAALGVGASSAIAGTAGVAAAEGAGRNIAIDDMMRNQIFPAGLKVVGHVYFPPKKKWPGSKDLQAVHLSYSLKGRIYRATAPIH